MANNKVIECVQRIKFEWDEAKNVSNYKKHGIRFEEAVRIFQDLTLTAIDVRKDYGELREVSIGRIGGIVCVTVVHTDRDSALRMISARPATRSERRKYDAYYKENTC